MSVINRILTYALGLFLVSSGVAKFTVGHVFQYIEHQSGLDVFYPYVNHAVGAAEILAGLLILVPATRLVGAIASAGVMAGAIGFHLSPWLGVSMPTGLADDAVAPWTSDDFTTDTTPLT
ncbi:MAG: MauE/DoxX family redox-associated membrane protein, partial [Actinomycetota bacterium]